MKNSQKVSKVIVLIFVSLLCISVLLTRAFAPIIEQSIKVLFKDIKSVMNGKQINLTDVNGKAVDLFIYNESNPLLFKKAAEKYIVLYSY